MEAVSLRKNILHHREYFGLADSHPLSLVSVLALLSAVIVGLNPQFGAELDGSYHICVGSLWVFHAKDMQLVHLC